VIVHIRPVRSLLAGMYPAGKSRRPSHEITVPTSLDLVKNFFESFPWINHRTGLFRPRGENASTPADF
jgi:hypothetical protein